MAGLPEKWLTAKRAEIGKHSLLLLSEIDGRREIVIADLRDVLRSHYVAPQVLAERLAQLGAPATAELLREHFPITASARSGDVGEIIATEVVERFFDYKVPIRRLRWKDGRNMALRGDDVVAIRQVPSQKLQFLKGEAKSRVSLAQSAIDEAAEVLDRGGGLPTRHAVLFVADRLREGGQGDVAKELEEAVLRSFHAHNVEHLLFVFTQDDPEQLLANHLSSCAGNVQRREAVGLTIREHQAFIEALFAES